MPTSETSARVGSGESIMDSSIWVATTTGMACCMASRTIRFCRVGTISCPISTARSPRATITPFDAATISFRFSIASGCSILAITGIAKSCFASSRRTAATSSALRTKLRASQSQSFSTANFMSLRSLAAIAGAVTSVSGKFTP